MSCVSKDIRKCHFFFRFSTEKVSCRMSPSARCTSSLHLSDKSRLQIIRKRWLAGSEVIPTFSMSAALDVDVPRTQPL